MDPPEVLEYAGRQSRLSSRKWLAALIVLAMLAGAAYLFDQSLLRREAATIRTCQARASSTIADSFAAIAAVAAYSRYTVVGAESVGREEVIYQLIEDFAARHTSDFVSVQRDCASAHVLVTHPGLRGRRDHCLKDLASAIAFVQAVASDGSKAYADRPSTAGCTAPTN